MGYPLLYIFLKHLPPSFTVNRVQTNTLAAIGTPSQSGVVAGLFKDVDRRLESLDQKFDAIQAVNEIYSLLEAYTQGFSAYSSTKHTLKHCRHK